MVVATVAWQKVFIEWPPNSHHNLEIQPAFSMIFDTFDTAQFLCDNSFHASIKLSTYEDILEWSMEKFKCRITR